MKTKRIIEEVKTEFLNDNFFHTILYDCGTDNDELIINDPKQKLDKKEEPNVVLAKDVLKALEITVEKATAEFEKKIGAEIEKLIKDIKLDFESPFIEDTIWVDKHTTLYEQIILDIDKIKKNLLKPETAEPKEFIIQKSVTITQKEIDEIIADLKKLKPNFAIGLLSKVLKRDEIIKEIKNLTEFGKAYLLMKKKYEEWSKKQKSRAEPETAKNKQ